jgi:hypothetical protein
MLITDSWRRRTVYRGLSHPPPESQSAAKSSLTHPRAFATFVHLQLFENPIEQFLQIRARSPPFLISSLSVIVCSIYQWRPFRKRFFLLRLSRWPETSALLPTLSWHLTLPT